MQQVFFNLFEIKGLVEALYNFNENVDSDYVIDKINELVTQTCRLIQEGEEK